MSSLEATEIYSERYVGFIDILGFTNIVAQSTGSPRQASALLAILEQIASRTKPLHFDELYGDDFRAQSFSDCIVVSEAVSPKGLAHLLAVITNLTLDLLSNGILLRGGVAKGLLHHSDKVVLGPALIAAYAIENTIAKFPRVVVDRGTHQDFKRYKLLPQSWDKTPRAQLAFDDDGPVFVDFFSPFRDLLGVRDPKILSIGGSCRAVIQSQLDESIYQPKIFEKLEWLGGYWNRVRNEQPYYDRMEPVVFPGTDDVNR